MKVQKLPDDIRSAIAAAYESGEPTKIIAHRYGIHDASVSTIAISLGKKRRSVRRPNGSGAHALGLAAVRLGLTVQDLELLAQSRPNPPMPGGQDRYGEQRESI